MIPCAASSSPLSLCGQRREIYSSFSCWLVFHGQLKQQYRCVMCSFSRESYCRQPRASAGPFSPPPFTA